MTLLDDLCEKYKDIWFRGSIGFSKEYYYRIINKEITPSGTIKIVMFVYERKSTRNIIKISDFDKLEVVNINDPAMEAAYTKYLLAECL